MKSNDKKRPKAAALSYDPGKDSAPKVIAAGRGKIAEEIIARAKKLEIPIDEEPELVEYLCQVPVGDEIPHELYQAVAEVLAFIFKLNLSK